MIMMKQSYSNLFGLLFLLCHLSNKLVFIQAQSPSCTSAQTLQPGNPFEAVALTNSTDVDISQFTINVLASDLPPGHWYTYTTSLSETRMTWFNIEPIYTDGIALVDTPRIAIFKGSCDSLSLVGMTYRDFGAIDGVPLENEVGVDFYIYIYHELFNLYPYTFTIAELEPPMNDKIANAVALTSQDLPFRGEFTTLGSRSDFSDDRCGLDAEYGVWFSYTTSFAQEDVSLQLEGFPLSTEVAVSSLVGIQAVIGGQVICIANGYEHSPVDWTAKRGIQYMILITWVNPADSFMFELQIQSRGGILDSPSSSKQTSSDAAAAFDTALMISGLLALVI